MCTVPLEAALHFSVPPNHQPIYYCSSAAHRKLKAQTQSTNNQTKTPTDAMAIDHQSISDSQYDLMRNAPTPNLNEEFNEASMMESFGDFGNQLFQSNQTLVFSQGPGSGGNSLQMYPDAMSGAMSAIPGQFSHLHTGSFSTSVYGQPFPEVSQLASAYPVSGRESVASQLSTTRDRKGKCMSRNAIAARDNREKKKHEAISMKNKVKYLEEENALYKKKYTEMKEAYQEDRKRLKYYDALFGNITSIGSLVPIVEHLKNLPERTTGKINEQIKEKFNINQNLSICCVIGENRDVTLRFCENCSAGSSSTKKKKAVET